MSELLRVQESHTKSLLKKQGVNGTAIGEKWVNGVPTGQQAVLVFVQKKFSAKSIADPNVLTAFSAKDLIPTEIDGIPTDVIEVGQIVKQAFKSKMRPIKPGFSVGHGKITAGTIGGVFLDKNNEAVILSNNHVLANENDAKAGDLIYQPGPLDSSGGGNDIGALKRFMMIKKSGNLHDSAIAKIHPSLISTLVDDTYPQINTRLTGFGDAVVGMQVQKCGRTTGYTVGRVIGINASFTIAYDFGDARFDKCVVCTNMSEGGDSGSIIQDMDERAVALLFAGSPRVTIANPMSLVRDFYGLKLYSDEPSKYHDSMAFSGYNWHIQSSGTDTVAVKAGVLTIDAMANHHCCLEMPIANFKTARCTVNTGSGKGATWASGLSIHWPNGYLKVNLRYGSAFGGYINGTYNINIGKVKPNKQYDLRIATKSTSYVCEVLDGGKWYTIIEVPKRIFPYPPIMVRIGKTDLNGGLTNYNQSGDKGTSFIKSFSLT
jgi:hypothetical protein